MKNWTIIFELGDQQVPLSVSAPVGLKPIDDYREVNFVLPGKGRHRAVFFHLPNKNSDDAYATKPTDQWRVPVRWDDNTMLFVSALDDLSILSAMSYIVQNGLEHEAFEDENDIALNGG